MQALENVIIVTDSELSVRYDELINENYFDINFGNLSYRPSEVLKAVDPVAYRCGLQDWASEDYVEFSGGYLLQEDFNSIKLEAWKVLEAYDRFSLASEEDWTEVELQGLALLDSARVEWLEAYPDFEKIFVEVLGEIDSRL